MKTVDAIRDLLNDVKEEAEEAKDGNTAGLCTRMLRDVDNLPQNYNVEIEVDEEDRVIRVAADGTPIKAIKYYDETGQVIPDIHAVSVDTPVFDGKGEQVEHPYLNDPYPQPDIYPSEPYVGELYDEHGLLIPEGTVIEPGRLVYDANGDVVNDPSQRNIETEARTTRVTDKVNVEAKTKAKVSDADGSEGNGPKGKAKSK